MVKPQSYRAWFLCMTIHAPFGLLEHPISGHIANIDYDCIKVTYVSYIQPFSIETVVDSKHIFEIVYRMSHVMSSKISLKKEKKGKKKKQQPIQQKTRGLRAILLIRGTMVWLKQLYKVKYNTILKNPKQNIICASMSK